MNNKRWRKWKLATCAATLALVAANAAMAQSAGKGYSGPVVSPTSLAFGGLQVGNTSAVQTFTVETEGKSAAKGSSLSIVSITFPPGFGRSGGTCPATGGAPDPCTVGVVFTPSAVAPFTGNVAITASSFSLPPGTSNVLVTGQGVGGGSVSVPSLGQWGMGLLLAALLTSGLLLLRRR